MLDIHSGGRVARYPPVILFHPVEDAEQGRLTIETRRLFGTPFICLFQDRTPGLMLSESERRGNVTIGSELGWGQFVGVQTVKYARQGIIGAAIMHGQLAGDVSPADHHAAGDQKIIEAVDRECYVAAPWPGHYEPLVELGATVKKGQAVALLHDYHRIDEEPWAGAGRTGRLCAGTERYRGGDSRTAHTRRGPRHQARQVSGGLTNGNGQRLPSSLKSRVFLLSVAKWHRIVWMYRDCLGHLCERTV